MLPARELNVETADESRQTVSDKHRQLDRGCTDVINIHSVLLQCLLLFRYPRLAHVDS